ncbi:MAG TPA: XRE family transcriptional regulator [Halothiobacillaceae bacterium]|nr:XRE family transcriptional regulator [Halothiobacillaceae bacterium]
MYTSNRIGCCCTGWKRTSCNWRGQEATLTCSDRRKAINTRVENVWTVIEDTHAQAENMRLRSSLMMALEDHIQRAGMTQAEAARVLGVTQPRLADLMRGKIDLFDLDALVSMAATAGLRIRLSIDHVKSPPQPR